MTTPETGSRGDGLPVVSVRDLSITFPTADGDVHAVQNLSFEVPEGGALGIVGESGSGKSVTSLALMGLHRGTRAQISGQILVAGTDVVAAHDRDIRAMRGNDIAMVFQDPMSSLHPQYTIGDQLVEAYLTHRPRAGRAEARKRAVEALDRVGIPEPGRRVNSYPHEFSGGMRQRAMIAMALVGRPDILIADEPTTALDVTTQAQILDLIRELQSELGMSLIMITHDLGVVAEMADDVAVMYLGTVAEEGTVDQIFHEPRHPYTRALLRSVPRVGEHERSKRLYTIAGSVPNPYSRPTGCPYSTRCDFYMDGLCNKVVPPPIAFDETHKARCLLYTNAGVQYMEGERQEKGVTA